MTNAPIESYVLVPILVTVFIFLGVWLLWRPKIALYRSRINTLVTSKTLGAIFCFCGICEFLFGFFAIRPFIVADGSYLWLENMVRVRQTNRVLYSDIFQVNLVNSRGKTRGYKLLIKYEKGQFETLPGSKGAGFHAQVVLLAELASKGYRPEAATAERQDVRIHHLRK